MGSPGTGRRERVLLALVFATTAACGDGAELVGALRIDARDAGDVSSDVIAHDVDTTTDADAADATPLDVTDTATDIATDTAIDTIDAIDETVPDTIDFIDTSDTLGDDIDGLEDSVEDVALVDADPADGSAPDSDDAASDDADVEPEDIDTGPVTSVCGLVTTVEDGRYADLGDAAGPVLRELLRDRIDDSVGFDYDQARDLMYVTAKIDVDADGLITGVYTGVQELADGTHSPGVITTEHSWPRSDGAAAFPAEGDVHHLFPAADTANNRRGSDEFGEVACAETEPASCPWGAGGSYSGAAVDGRARVFEVRVESRGDIARAHFYFAVRYGLPIPALEEATLRAWHCEDPVDEHERDRNDAIFFWQLNRNPFVDQPQLVERISDY